MSEVFVPLAVGERQALGQPELPYVIVPHPVASRSADELEGIGERLVDDVLRLLTSSAERS